MHPQHADLLLVGSLPAASSEEALRAGGELFGDLVFALPDGETGRRSSGWDTREHLLQRIRYRGGRGLARRAARATSATAPHWPSAPG